MGEISPSEITPEHVYLSRRKFLVGVGAFLVSTTFLSSCGEQDSLPGQLTGDGCESV